MKIYPVIMAGGSGTRFWPLSRKNRPKQFLALAGDPAPRRHRDPAPAAREGRRRPSSCAGRPTPRRCAGCCPKLPKQNFIVEPCARNTAPCVGLAALHVAPQRSAGRHRDAPGGPPHRAAGRVPRFARLRRGSSRSAASSPPSASSPSRPETGYGYLKIGPRLAARGRKGKVAHKVERFVEKPDVVTAARYLTDGGYLWNSGIFAVPGRRHPRRDPARDAGPRRAARRASTRPSARRALRADARAHLPGAVRPSPSTTASWRSRKRIAVVPADFGWSRRRQLRGAARRAPTDRARQRRRGRRGGRGRGTTWWSSRRAGGRWRWWGRRRRGGGRRRRRARLPARPSAGRPQAVEELARRGRDEML